MLQDRESDLDPPQIAELTQKLQSEQAALRPLATARQSISELAAIIAGNPNYEAKVSWLSSSGWSAIRFIRGDGDCFYRSFAFGFVEQVLSNVAPEVIRTSVESTFQYLDVMGYDKEIYGDFYEPLKSLLDSQLTAESLHSFFNDAESSNSTVVLFRLITSCFIKTHAWDFEPFLFALEEDYTRFPDGIPSIDQFCSFAVEPSGKEADNVQIAALSQAFNASFAIAHLDQSLQGDQVNFHFFGSLSNGENAEDPHSYPIVFLYRPGHYDLLY